MERKGREIISGKKSQKKKIRVFFSRGYDSIYFLNLSVSVGNQQATKRCRRGRKMRRKAEEEKKEKKLKKKRKDVSVRRWARFFFFLHRNYSIKSLPKSNQLKGGYRKLTLAVLSENYKKKLGSVVGLKKRYYSWATFPKQNFHYPRNKCILLTFFLINISFSAESLFHFLMINYGPNNLSWGRNNLLYRIKKKKKYFSTLTRGFIDFPHLQTLN